MKQLTLFTKQGKNTMNYTRKILIGLSIALLMNNVVAITIGRPKMNIAGLNKRDIPSDSLYYTTVDPIMTLLDSIKDLGMIHVDKLNGTAEECKRNPVCMKNLRDKYGKWASLTRF